MKEKVERKKSTHKTDGKEEVKFDKIPNEFFVNLLIRL